MVAMVILGMSSLGWVVILAGQILGYKLGPAPTMRRRWLLWAVLVALGVAYRLMA
jgi:hypothetical protein